MKTLLIGNFGAGNVGDELILASALQTYPDAMVMTSDAEFSEAFLEKKLATLPPLPTGVRSFLRWIFVENYASQWKKIEQENVEHIVFPGGGLFAIKLRACFIWFMTFCWVQKLFPGKKIIFECQGVDQNLSWIAKKMLHYVVNRSSKFTVRDDGSADAILGICGKYVENVGDRVEQEFKMAGEQTFVRLQGEDEFEGGGQRILINAIKPFVFARLQHQFPDAHFVFIAFDPKDLESIPEDFIGEVVYPTMQREFLARFQNAEMIVGERFHALLLGVLTLGPQRTRLLRQPYAEKVEALVRRFEICLF